MKRFTLILAACLTFQGAIANECLEVAVCEMNELYSVGDGCEDGVYNAVSSSMLGWGIGLFAGIAILTGLVHQSKGSAGHNESSSSQ